MKGANLRHWVFGTSVDDFGGHSIQPIAPLNEPELLGLRSLTVYFHSLEAVCHTKFKSPGG
jgi:hypothetical protein